MPIVRHASYTGYSFPSRYQKIIVQRWSEFVPRYPARELRPAADNYRLDGVTMNGYRNAPDAQVNWST
jgi:hypothetical protein